MTPSNRYLSSITANRYRVLWHRCRASRCSPHVESGRRFSSRITDKNDDSSFLNKLGVGGNKWARMEASQYGAVVQTALENRIATLEVGQDGESALRDAYKYAMENVRNPPAKVEITARLGYRTLLDGDEEKSRRLSHDVTIEEHPVTGYNNESESSHAKVVHNLSKQHVELCLKNSPLVQLRGEDSDRIDLIYMLHNPEVQGKDDVMDRMVDAFCGLEEGVANGQISSFGVCSNGLALPEKHPLHLPYKTVLEAATRASETVHGCSSASGLTTLQLPINLLEATGFLVARDVAAHVKESGDFTSGISIYAMRPLTCYSQGGTGTDHPLNLLDYAIPVMGSTTNEPVWTHEMVGPPPGYGQALNAAMGHFDATEILEAQEERELCMEERETLDGCKLLHSMLHDLDAGLEDITSFAAYEHELYTRVIPLIHDTFEELDDESATILQNFFSAHGQAVRYGAARNTRELLKNGGKESPPYDIPDSTTLQEYALQFLLREESVAKVIVGCEQTAHVLEARNAALQC